MIGRKNTRWKFYTILIRSVSLEGDYPISDKKLKVFKGPRLDHTPISLNFSVAFESRTPKKNKSGYLPCVYFQSSPRDSIHTIVSLGSERLV